jgi:hypothetical protein
MLAPESKAGPQGCAPGAEPIEWQFLQCFGERTPGEEVQEGESGAGRMARTAIARDRGLFLAFAVLYDHEWGLSKA